MLVFNILNQDKKRWIKLDWYTVLTTWKLILYELKKVLDQHYFSIINYVCCMVMTFLMNVYLKEYRQEVQQKKL